MQPAPFTGTKVHLLRAWGGLVEGLKSNWGEAADGAVAAVRFIEALGESKYGQMACGALGYHERYGLPFKLVVEGPSRFWNVVGFLELLHFCLYLSDPISVCPLSPDQCILNGSPEGGKGLVTNRKMNACGFCLAVGR